MYEILVYNLNQYTIIQHTATYSINAVTRGKDFIWNQMSPCEHLYLKFYMVEHCSFNHASLSLHLNFVYWGF